MCRSYREGAQVARSEHERAGGRPGPTGGPAETDPRSGTRRPQPLLRRSVPSARAATGGLLVALATLLVFVALRDDGAPEGRAVVVAAHDVAPGTRLQAADLTIAHLAVPDGWGSLVTRPEDLVDAVTLSPLAQGDLVQASAVVAAASAPASYEVALTLPPDRVVADRLRPGDRVDVLATVGTGGTARTEVVVRAALVQARTSSSGGLGADAVGITLGVADPTDVLAVAHALRAAEVTLVRSTGAADGLAGPTTWPPGAAAAGGAA